MSETITATLPLRQWHGEKATYHLVTFTGAEAEALASHALMQRLEFGRARGFGSLKVNAEIGETSWKTSVFPQKEQTEWVLLVSRKVIKREDLAVEQDLDVSVTPI